MQGPQTRQGSCMSCQVCAPGVSSPPLRALGGAEVRAPSLRLASSPGICPNWDLFPKRSSTPRLQSAHPELASPFPQNNARGWKPHGGLLQEVLLTMYGS